MKTDTPRTDEEARLTTLDCDDSCVDIYIKRDQKTVDGDFVIADFARTLERENNALRAQLAKPSAPMTWTEEDEARFQAKNLEGNWLDYADEPEVALP